MQYHHSSAGLFANSWRSSHLLSFTGKIRDPLHDSIGMTDAEHYVIDHPYFQRLRRVRQTAFMNYVFPGATHSRFEHSLGVMHMAGVMYESLIVNQTRILAEVEKSLKKQTKVVLQQFANREKQMGSLRNTKNALQFLEDSAYLAQCLRFAALLHDIGHSPFSHSGERFLVTWKELAAQLDTIAIPEYLKTAFRKQSKRVLAAGRGETERIRHEIYSLMMISQIFTQETLLLGPQMGQDICAILLEDVEPHAGGDLEKSGLRSLFHEIVSGELDVDRMDYLLRDSRQCGVIYGLFDAWRILDSACFYHDEQQGNYHLALRKRGVAAFEDYLRARWSMYQQVYFHKTATACEAMLQHLQRGLEGITLPLSLEDYVALDDWSFFGYLATRVEEKQMDKKVLNPLRDLLYFRKLWKRVYEETTPTVNLGRAPSLCPAIVGMLRQRGYDAEEIESSTSLTRFSPRGRQRRQTSNTLRVVVKDLHLIRYLEPIEQHSNLVNRLDEETTIRRIFVPKVQSDGQEVDIRGVQNLITETVITPTW